MTDLNAALVEQFLNVSVAQGKAVIQPNRVLDDCHRETVAIGFRVSHGGSAYPDPVQATYPAHLLKGLTAAPSIRYEIGVNRHAGELVGPSVQHERVTGSTARNAHVMPRAYLHDRGHCGHWVPESLNVAGGLQGCAICGDGFP